ncbi:MAG: esterase-like activity of phytase family protein [Pseudomonadota bacterium]
MIINRLALSAALLCSTAVVGAHADAFNRIASFPVALNLPEGTDPATETSPEIIDATDDGMMVVYTDSPLEAIGLVDISDPANPTPAGAVLMGGEPTSLVVKGTTAFVVINTSESYTDPSGLLKIVDLNEKTVSDSCNLGGQPDSTALAPDGSFLAIAIENERDEDLNDGVIPQLPAGNVVIIPLDDVTPNCDGMITADLTGLADVAGSDPEPEFVDINSAGEIVVTLQENNHIAILDKTGNVISHFSAGAVTLENVDTEEEGAITFNATQADRKREPDAVKWLDDNYFVMANEGDYEGGSRGFTIFHKDGTEFFESGLSFEYAVAAAGHYPEERSGNKGVEPEGLAVGTYGDTGYIFVLAERSGIIGVYRDDDREPVLTQLLPSGIGPEGAVAIPSRNLLVSANEADLGEDGGPRAHVMIYELQEGADPAYPTISSLTTAGTTPIGWGALSGLVADEETPGRLYAVSDSFYGMAPQIFVIDANQTPATIEAAIPVTRNLAMAQKLDLEGITTDGEGGFWLASEGRSDRLIPHALYHVDSSGEIEAEVAFPPELAAVERRFGSEGVTRVGDVLWIAVQREWKDDPKGTVKLVSYNTDTKEWGAVRYPLEAPSKGWMGLSEITAHGDFMYIVERDNQIGDDVVVKRLYRVPMSQMTPSPLGGDLPTVTKELVHDFVPDLKAWNGFVVDKVEGFAIDVDGTAFVVTDNDGTDDSSGETFFWSIGKID